jgi:DNA-binding MarR family transcriptional regulator
MTVPDVPDVPAAAAARTAGVRALSEQLPRFLRLAHAFKTTMAAEGRDRAALVLLYPLVRLGPLRQTALADLVHADPSTVSRHVAALVEQGLVRRVADESDGRATRLVVTDAGRVAFDGLCAERESHLRRATAGWSDADLATLTDLFARLLDDLSTTLPGSDACGPTDAPRENR